MSAPAQPEQPLRQRIAQALAATDVHWGYHCGFSAAPDDDMTAAYVTAALAVVQPDLDARDAEIQQLRAAENDLHRRLNDIENLCDHAESAALADWQNPQPVPQWAVDARAICRREPAAGPRPTTQES